MMRRELLGAGLAALTASSVLAQTPHSKEEAHRHDAVHKECLDACSECARMCDETFHHCYMEVAEGKRDHAKPLHLVSDCAGFCSLSACMIAKHSPLMAYSCASCADACKTTAAELEKFDSPEMKAAVKSLKRCEDSCRAMVKAMGDHSAHHHESPAK